MALNQKKKKLLNFFFVNKRFMLRLFKLLAKNYSLFFIGKIIIQRIQNQSCIPESEAENFMAIL